MNVQIIIAIIAFIVLLIVTLSMYLKRRNTNLERLPDEQLTMDRLLEIVKKEMSELAKEETFYGKTDAEWEALYNRKKRIRSALDNCIYGDISDKIVVQDLIRNIIKDKLPDEEAIQSVIDLDSEFISPEIQFEIVMYLLKKTKGQEALAYMIRNYKLAEVRYDIEEGETPCYGISADDMGYVYRDVCKEPLNYNQKLDIVSILLYQKYRGFGKIDTIDEMYIDGYNCGTSGSILYKVRRTGTQLEKATKSTWLYFEGKYIHLRFIDFESEEELRRIVLLLCRYNNPGSLTAKRGYLVNTKKNKSRVLALRPPASEYWAVFVRNFNLSSQTLSSLLNPIQKNKETGEPVYEEVPLTEEEYDDIIEHPEYHDCVYDLYKKVKKVPVYVYKNAFLVEETIKYAMQGQVTSAFTGRQGSGKTTLMTAAIKPIDARLTLRVLELSPEMYLRELYSQRNILSVQETDWVTAEALQDALKKSDAAVSIVGEVATNIVAARMLQMGQVASLFTIFSHHAVRTVDLVNALTNSIVATSFGAATPETVMPQVLDVVKLDIHLDYDVYGNRYIERISEIVRVDNEEYPKREAGESLSEYDMRVRLAYYKKMTDRKMFEVRDILVFDKSTFTYYTKDFFSEELTAHMLKCMPDEKIESFKAFCLENWG